MAKLMLYDARACLRLLVPVCAGCLALNLLAAGAAWLSTLIPGYAILSMPAALLILAVTMLAAAARIAALVIGPVAGMMRVYRMLGTEGMFYFMLPVSPARLLASQLLLTLGQTVAGLLSFQCARAVLPDALTLSLPDSEEPVLLLGLLLMTATLFLAFCLAAAVSTRFGPARLPLTVILLFVLLIACGAVTVFGLLLNSWIGLPFLDWIISLPAAYSGWFLLLVYAAPPLAVADLILWLCCCRMMGPRLELA